MPNATLSFIANNDPLVTFNLSQSLNAPVDLSAAVATIYLKASPQVPDTDSSVIKYVSSTVGSPLVIPAAPAVPAAPTVTPTGTAGGTLWDYVICATNAYGSTVASPVGSTATGNSVLSSTDYNALSWAADTGATRYNVYRLVNNAYQQIGSTTGTTFNDTGQTPTTATPPVVNTTAGIVTMQFHSTDFVGVGWYHLDIAINGLVLTYAYGPLSTTQV